MVVVFAGGNNQTPGWNWQVQGASLSNFARWESVILCYALTSVFFPDQVSNYK
jgi:hypothetical protein